MKKCYMKYTFSQFPLPSAPFRSSVSSSLSFWRSLVTVGSSSFSGGGIWSSRYSASSMVLIRRVQVRTHKDLEQDEEQSRQLITHRTMGPRFMSRTLQSEKRLADYCCHNKARCLFHWRRRLPAVIMFL